MNTRGQCVTTIPILLPEHVGSEIYLPSTPPPRHPSSPQLNKSLHCFYAFVFGPSPTRLHSRDKAEINDRIGCISLSDS